MKKCDWSASCQCDECVNSRQLHNYTVGLTFGATLLLIAAILLSEYC